MQNITMNDIKGSLIVLSYMAIGAALYDTCIKLDIRYNESKSHPMLCEKGIAYQRIGEEGTVYLKTTKECINESMKGSINESQTVTKSNQR